MEAIMCRASNVMISYGAIRGRAAGTQETEKKQGINKSTTEKARLGEKSAAGGNGRRFNMDPLPFLSARNSVSAPSWYLWFPGKKGEDAKIGVKGRGRDALIVEAGDLMEDQEKEVVGLLGDEKSGGVVAALEDVVSRTVNSETDIVVSVADLESEPKIEGEKESSKFENGNVAKRWVQNLLNVNFLRKSTTVDVSLPATNLLTKEDGSLTLDCNRSVSGVNAEPQESCAAGKCVGNQLECVGCASEISENYIADPVLSPLSTLEVPHVNVTHDLESFSKFLSEVPLTELRIIAQSSFLSNLAYVIPEIMPGDLARHHHMMFVTSSLDIKARAIAQEKADALAKAIAAEAKSKSERTESGGEVPTQSYLSPLKAYALTAAAAKFLWSQKKTTQELTEEAEDGTITREENGDDLKTEYLDEGAVKNPLDSESMEEFLGCESNPVHNKNELHFSSSDMSDFMRPVTSVISAEKETRQEVANNLRSLHTCPCEWFVCDEKNGHTRFLSIQGSDSFASWQANLLFEPMQFEASELGVMVHRGIYEAAIGLYDQILPYIIEHQERHGELARFRFTGHSLGGSLAMLLSLMLNIRGVVKTSEMLPVFTFGAPYIMCGGDYLLRKLGFPPDHIQYIIMNRDIVPRTFACNYPDHIAEVLKRVNGTFRDHSCLTRQRLLYAPMGHLMILQPDRRQSPDHPLLPSGSGLYLIRHQSHNEPSIQQVVGEEVSSRAVQVRAAQRAFLNKPHPLEIISDPAAYGSEGTISKNHDPRNYERAINSVLRQEMKKHRRVQRERRRELWWPLISARTANLSNKGANSSVQKERGALRAIRSEGMCGSSKLGHYASDVAGGRYTFPLSVSGNLKGRYNRYKSLIASQHVQLVMVVLLTARMFLEEGFAIALTWV